MSNHFFNMHSETRQDFSEFPTTTKIIRPLRASLLTFAWGTRFQNVQRLAPQEGQPLLSHNILLVLAAAIWIKKFVHEDLVSLLHSDSTQQEVNHQFKTVAVDLSAEISASEALTQIESSCAAPFGSKHPTESPCLLLRFRHGQQVQLPEALRTSLVLAYSCDEASGDVQVALHSNPLAVSRARTEILGKAYSEIYETLANSCPATDLTSLYMAQPADIAQLQHWNRSPIIKRWATVHGLTESLALDNPDHPAVVAWDLCMTRGELDLSASRMSDIIRLTLRTRQPSAIGVLIDKSGWVPVVILAVLKAGHSFVLLDQHLPLLRLSKMMDQLGCLAIITSKENVGLAAQLRVAHVMHCNDSGVVSSLRPSTTDQHLPHERVRTSPESLLCYMFTSGSTGEPKAIEHSHVGFCSSIPSTPEHGLIQEGTRMLQSSSYNFVPSIVELLGSLVGGGTVCIPSAYEKTNDLNGAIKRLNANFAIMSPSLANTLDLDNSGPLRTLWLAGEPCPSNMIRRLSVIPGLSSYLVYGLTETLCAVTKHRLEPDAIHSNSTIGKAYAMRIWLVHPKNPAELVAVGAVGEIVVEGYSVANHYMGNAEQSRETFIDAPQWMSRFSDTEPRTRWLRTGDLGIYDDDGNVQILGRGNRHIKLHGQRIEPAEVEGTIKSCLADEIELVAVEVTYRDNNAARPRLTAFIVPSILCGTPKNSPSELWTDRIRDALVVSLPSFMVPTHTIIVDRMPRTASGKIDRRALATMGGLDSEHSLPTGHQDYAADEGPEQSPTDKLRTLWSKVLHINPSQIKDKTSWSELGGDSLQSIKLATAARQEGISLTVGQIMLQPRLEDQAQLIRPGGILQGSEDNVATEDFDTTSGMTGFQLFANQRARTPRHSLVYYVPVRIRGSFDNMRLLYALRALVDRHDALRLQFSEQEDKLCVCQHGDRNVTSRIQVLECEDADHELQVLMQLGLSGKQSSQFDQPVVILLLLSPQSTRLLIKLHHACIDGSSMALFWNRLQMFYDNPSCVSTMRTPQFMPYLQHRLLQSGDESQAFWCDLLRGSRPLFLRKPRHEITNGHESGTDITASRVVILPPVPIPGGVTVSTLVKAAWAVVLSFLTGETDIMFYHLVHGRDETWERASEILGCCIADVPLRVRLADTSPSELLQTIHHQVLSSLPHAHLGAARIADLMRADWGEDAVQYSHSTFVQHQNIDSVTHFALGEGAYADVEAPGIADDAIPELSVYSEPWGHGAVEISVRASNAWYRTEEVDALVEALAWATSNMGATEREAEGKDGMESSWSKRMLSVMEGMSIQSVR
jgi:amino acid adenylation domain-containing protein